jgi:hypothetical protein
LDTKTREGEPETGLLETMEQGDPTPENLLRVRMQKDALPQAGFSSKKPSGNSGHGNLSPSHSDVNERTREK